MQIFASYSCPYLSAAALDDKRVVKMCVETAQILSTVMHMYGRPDAPYKSTHKNHPCVLWAAESQVNYAWLVRHFMALLDEYTGRYGRVHKCEQYTNVFLSVISHSASCLGVPAEFANCTPYKDMETHQAYQMYLNDRWESDIRAPKWYGVAA